MAAFGVFRSIRNLLPGQRHVRTLIEVNGRDLELFFATETLGLRSLHYGFWDTPPEGEPTLASLREAQARFTERLLAHVPPGVRTILDVGAGIGDNASALAARGYRVTSISPDKNHGRYFEDIPAVTFHQTTFEDFDSPERFDLVFISEALNYFDRVRGLEQCRRYVRPGGHLLVAAMFRETADGRPFSDKFVPTDLAYVHQAREFGFTLEDARDITENTAPTMDMANAVLRRYVEPTVGLLDHFLTGTAPLKAWALKLVFAKQLRDLGRIHGYYLSRTDPATFRRAIRYVILGFGT